MNLSLVVANLKNNRQAVAYLRARSRPRHPEHYDIGLISEAHKRRRDLGRFLGHDYLTGPTGGGTRPGRLTGNLTQDCGILLARDLPNLGHAYEYLSPAHPASEKIGHERWGQVVVTEYGGRQIALICLHPIAKPDGAERRDRYLMAVRWLDAEIAKHVTLGREVIAGGDLQVREHDKGLHSPRHVFANHDMRWHWKGIDVVAWTPGLTATRRRVLEDFRQQTGHPWLRIDLNLNTRRNR